MMKKTDLQTEFAPGQTESKTPCKAIVIPVPFRHRYHCISHSVTERALTDNIAQAAITSENEKNTFIYIL